MSINLSSPKRPLPFKEFKRIYSKVNRLNIEIVLKSENGVLLTLRAVDPFKGLWHLPGGTVHFREPVEDAVRRVALDELGVEVQVEKMLGYIEYPSVIKNNGFDCPIGLAFLCSSANRNFTLDDQASEAKFFKELPKDIIIEQKIFLNDHLDTF